LIFFIIYGATEPIINGPVSFPVFVMYLAVARIISPAAVTAPIVKRSDGSIAALAGAAGR
jgi:hypothetical protein